MASSDPSSADFFESLYRERADPWNFAGSDYEQGRFNAILAMLAPKRYRHAFEPGCSIGTLTERLAPVCDKVTACDFSSTAVQRAKERCAGLPNTHISVGALTRETPMAGYDLILFSEIGYYFAPSEWKETVAALSSGMAPGTTLLASHWLGHSDDHKQSGDDVHAVLRAEPLLQAESDRRFPGFRLNRFLRR